MRFLVLSISREALPPERVLGLIAAKREWVAEHRASGKLRDVFSLAGRSSSGYILDVASHEELTAIRAADPFGPFSDVDIYPLSDLERAFDIYEQVMQQRAGDDIRP